MEIEQIISQLEQIRHDNSFNTRGLPFAKKMWRDGYNKALQDIIIHFKIKLVNVGDNEALNETQPSTKD